MAAFIPSSTDVTVQLRDGRRVGLAVIGPEDGFPIIHCHGSGSSRLEVTLLAAQAEQAGVRLIALDRPGVGLSDPKPGYRLLDWPDDVAEVADHLGIKRFAVEGFSAGGPYALACAARLPQRLTACGLISTISPPDLMGKTGTVLSRIMWKILPHIPYLLKHYARLVQRQVGFDVTSIARYLALYAVRLGEADRQLLSHSEIREQLARVMAESFRQGAQGNLEVVMIETQSWGFQVEQLACEQVFLWHGEQDRIAPAAAARLLAQRLPHCRATFYLNEGHFSTLAHHCLEIFSLLRE
ncbi:alpha/beta fold hydrolase [Thermogemmatispora tikiterensis]|uniref:AB hydrolase-1 domain-containing protein n=1 Tax=Thermogemmatispora tikiterensis TaxID=1825093 RepID=A0A328VEY5_9CHLR|nr:alpha/beta hydrolase [Thermogemmatispora tikiterensis]RAQ94103.1 hypothetical protein A4R35_01070 [Thermogemmatispora tikiterensis]